MRSKLIARAGLASLPITAFAPAVGTIWTGYGAPWMVLPVGSMVALVGGGCAHRRAASTRRGVVVTDPDLNKLRETVTPPRDLITVEFAWSDEAA